MSPITPLPLPPYQLRGISRRQIEEHYKLYYGDVVRANEVESRLAGVDRAGANTDYSPYRGLKVEEGYLLDSARLHAAYFMNLGGPGGIPPAPLLPQIMRDFGTYESWLYDFLACGRAARGWAVLAWDCQMMRLRDILTDTHDLGPLWHAMPLLVLDVYEHAYFLDYGANRDGYIDAFMRNVNWNEVARRFASMALAPGRPAPAFKPPPPAPGMAPVKPTPGVTPGFEDQTFDADSAMTQEGAAAPPLHIAQPPAYPYNLRPSWPK